MIRKKTAEILEELIKIRRELHRNPELSMQEYWTSQYVFNILTSHGIRAKVMDGGWVSQVLLKENCQEIL